MTKKAIVLIGILCFAAPYAVRAASQQDLLTQIETLLGQVRLLQARLHDIKNSQTQTVAVSTPSLGTRFCPTITRVLARGDKGVDVKQLQQFLVEEGYLNSDSVTGFFGVVTETAVMRYQTAFNISTYGDQSTTGHGTWGFQSRLHMAQRCRGQVAQAEATSTPRIVGIDSPAMLNVGSRGTWKVKVANPTSDVLYTVLWGDQNLASAQSGAAVYQTENQQSPVFSHVFSQPGMYAVRFSATNRFGTSQGSAVVQVAGYATSTSALDFRVTAPNGGQVLTRGTEVVFEWTGSTALTGGRNVVSLTLEPRSSGAVKKDVINLYASQGSYRWKIPENIAPGMYVLRVTLTDGTCLSVGSTSIGSTCTGPVPVISFDESDYPFSIVGATSVQTLSVTPVQGVTPLEVAVAFPNEYASIVAQGCASSYSSTFSGRTFDINWGDGSYPIDNGRGYPCVRHTYTQPGTYTITGRIYDFSDTSRPGAGFTQDVWLGTAMVTVRSN